MTAAERLSPVSDGMTMVYNHYCMRRAGKITLSKFNSACKMTGETLLGCRGYSVHRVCVFATKNDMRRPAKVKCAAGQNASPRDAPRKSLGYEIFRAARRSPETIIFWYASGKIIIFLLTCCTYVNMQNPPQCIIFFLTLLVWVCIKNTRRHNVCLKKRLRLVATRN